MYMGITVSIGEGTELSLVAQSSDYHGNAAASGPQSLTILFKPKYLSQIHQMRINTILQDCNPVVKLSGEFLDTEDHPN